MKALRKISVTLFLFCLVGLATAQDVIVMKDQSTVMTKVLEITSTEIKYKKWNNQDGPTYSILRSEVASINYENGEVEKLTDISNNQQLTNQQVQTLNGSMVNYGTVLYLNGRKLSDNEVKNLVDTQNYQLYLKAGRQNKTAYVFIIGGGIGLAIAGIAALVDHEKDYHSTNFKIKIASTTTGLILGMTGWILESSASNKAKKVAETYNQNHSSHYSFNISPSLMKCEIPQGNCGLGLTVSMNF